MSARRRQRPTGLSAPHTIAGTLQRAALKRFHQHRDDGMLPTNDRFIWYELEHDGVVSKEQPEVKPGCRMTRKPSQNLTDAILYLRELGEENGGIPWEWVEDETRSMHKIRTARTVADYLDTSVLRATIDRWGGKTAPLVLCESRSLAGVLRATADDCACYITSTNGQTRGFLMTDVVPFLRPYQRVLYFGDLDLSGGHIEANTHSVLAKNAHLWAASEMQVNHRIARAMRRHGKTDLVPLWERVAITPEQVEEVNVQRALDGLGDATIMKTDRRYIDPETGEKGVAFPAVETEVLGQARIVNALKARLDELMPEPLEAVLEREEREIAEMQEVLRQMRGRRSK